MLLRLLDLIETLILFETVGEIGGEKSKKANKIFFFIICLNFFLFLRGYFRLSRKHCTSFNHHFRPMVPNIKILKGKIKKNNYQNIYLSLHFVINRKGS